MKLLYRIIKHNEIKYNLKQTSFIWTVAHIWSPEMLYIKSLSCRDSLIKLMFLGSNLFYKFIFVIVDLLLLEGGKYK